MEVADCSWPLCRAPPAGLLAIEIILPGRPLSSDWFCGDRCTGKDNIGSHAVELPIEHSAWKARKAVILQGAAVNKTKTVVNNAYRSERGGSGPGARLGCVFLRVLLRSAIYVRLRQELRIDRVSQLRGYIGVGGVLAITLATQLAAGTCTAGSSHAAQFVASLLEVQIPAVPLTVAGRTHEEVLHGPTERVALHISVVDGRARSGAGRRGHQLREHWPRRGVSRLDHWGQTGGIRRARLHRRQGLSIRPGCRQLWRDSGLCSTTLRGAGGTAESVRGPRLHAGGQHGHALVGDHPVHRVQEVEQ